MSFIDKIFPKEAPKDGDSVRTPKPPSEHLAKLKAKFSRSGAPSVANPSAPATALPTPTSPATTSSQPSATAAATQVTSVAQTPPSSPGISSKELAAKRDALATQRRQLQWDLGGLVYEMSIRDHFRLDVVVARAAKLQETDAQLAEVERMLRMDAQGAAGHCPECSAVYSRGAVFCWQCGHQLLERSASTAVPSPS